MRPSKKTKRKSVYRMAMHCAQTEFAEIEKRYVELASRKSQLSIAISILRRLAGEKPR